MFGIKLRSWMEAVRPRKKQQRKEKLSKSNVISSGTNVEWQKTPVKNILQDKRDEDKKETLVTHLAKDQTQNQSGPSGVSNSRSSHSRYSANNLSSPESAYSTGYSTDGTSPGTGVPPDYLHINSSRKLEIRYYPIEAQTEIFDRDKPKQTELEKIISIPASPRVSRVVPTSSVVPGSAHVVPRSPIPSNLLSGRRTPILMNQETEDARIISAQARSAILHGGSPALGLTSPRQRNRIRTNPWLPGGAPSPIHSRQEFHKNNLISATRTPIKESPRLRRFLSPSVRRKSLSSSSCSSLSGTSLHWEPARPRSARSASDEDDCTLNEMMGKYDESYVYEKETDILSDSDPTDCDTDIDTGQDGGDEDEPLDVELDFIDNGSYLEFEPKSDQNTGHCSYYTFDVQRKSSSRRRATRRNKQPNDKRRRSSSNKKRHKQTERIKSNPQLDGSKSAGATPLSVRRANHRPILKLALDDGLKRRSNSISFCRDPLSTIDKRDKEADRKYKELIVEAEHILRNMKSNGLSPRRVPGPANKRVELLRNTECVKPDHFIKNRPLPPEENGGTLYSKIPSNNFSCPRFSPKKNHITNFIINNSPISVRRERDIQAQSYNGHTINYQKKAASDEHSIQKTNTYRDKNNEAGTRRSPKYRKKAIKQHRNLSSSSESENERGARNRNSSLTRVKSLGQSCPQSEPVRRKVYFEQNIEYFQPKQLSTNHGTIQCHAKTVAFNFNKENTNNNPTSNQDCHTRSTENLRQQVLLNTIASLKRNLEDQSASLKQVYRSSQNIHVQ